MRRSQTRHLLAWIDLAKVAVVMYSFQLLRRSLHCLEIKPALSDPCLSAIGIFQPECSWCGQEGGIREEILVSTLFARKAGIKVWWRETDNKPGYEYQVEVSSSALICMVTRQRHHQTFSPDHLRQAVPRL